MKRVMRVGDLCQIDYRKHWWKVLGFNEYGVIAESQEYRPQLVVVNPHLIGNVTYREDLVRG